MTKRVSNHLQDSCSAHLFLIGQLDYDSPTRRRSPRAPPSLAQPDPGLLGHALRFDGLVQHQRHIARAAGRPWILQRGHRLADHRRTGGLRDRDGVHVVDQPGRRHEHARTLCPERHLRGGRQRSAGFRARQSRRRPRHPPNEWDFSWWRVPTRYEDHLRLVPIGAWHRDRGDDRGADAGIWLAPPSQIGIRRPVGAYDLRQLRPGGSGRSSGLLPCRRRAIRRARVEL